LYSCRRSVGKEAVGANVCLTVSTKIIDVTGDEPIEMKGLYLRALVIPELYQKSLLLENFSALCLIIGTVNLQLILKPNNALREYDVAV
jgi:2,3,4,5-tetrahydropyridine-2-carboxylate N-succinyltransferase